MEISIENKNLLERKHFLIRAVANGHADEKASENEIKELDRQIQQNMVDILNNEFEKRSQDVQDTKIKAKTDGEMKRNVALYFLKFMQDNGFANDEIKGVFRQGYKISRYI